MKTVVYYEVFERKSQKLNDFWRQYDKKGKYDGFETVEVYPSNESFGNWAYCCCSLELAQKSKRIFNLKYLNLW